MKNAAFILLAILISSCGNPTQQTRKADNIARDNTDHYCYAWVSGKDSILMQLQLTGQQVRGNLSYYYFEKDKSQGTIAGSMSGDTLFATYTFFAEGTKSTREVAFLKKGTDFAEGYGDVTEHNGSMIFSNTAGLDFNHSALLKNRDCR